MSLLRNSSQAAISALVLTGSRFFLTAVLARSLGSEDFGKFVYAQWLVDIVFLVCSIGTTGAISRFSAEFRSDENLLNELIRRWRKWVFITPVAAGALIVFGAIASDLKLSFAAISALILWTSANAMWAMHTAALAGLQRFDCILYANVSFSIVALGGALLLPMHGSNTNTFLLLALACSIASLWGMKSVHGRRASGFGSLGPAQVRTIRNYALNMWAIALLWALLWSRGELPVVRYYLGVSGVAHYAAALTLFSGAVQGVMLGISAVAPQLTKLWGSGKKDQALATARAVMDFQLLMCGCGAIALINIGPELLGLVFGKSYQEQASTLAIMSIGLVSMALSSQNHLLQISTNGNFSRNSSVGGLLILGGLAFSLIPTHGVMGAASSRMGTMLVLMIVSTVRFGREWGFGSMAMGNLLFVFSIVFINAATFIFSPDASLIRRLVIAVASILSLMVFVRNVFGESKVVEIISVIKRRRVLIK